MNCVIPAVSGVCVVCNLMVLFTSLFLIRFRHKRVQMCCRISHVEKKDKTRRDGSCKTCKYMLAETGKCLSTHPISWNIGYVVQQVSIMSELMWGNNSHKLGKTLCRSAAFRSLWNVSKSRYFLLCGWLCLGIWPWCAYPLLGVPSCQSNV